MTSIPSGQLSTPTHLHPLLPEEGSSRGRRSRGKQTESGDSKPATDYFTLKAQLESSAEEHTKHSHANWDGSVRGYGKGRKRKHVKPAPLIVVESSSGHFASPSTPSYNNLESVFSEPSTPTYSNVESVLSEPVLGESVSHSDSQILLTTWHEMSDSDIESAILQCHESTPQSSVPSHPYHSVLRVLSSAVHHLTRIRRELEESRRLLLEKDAARRDRASQLLQELPPSEKGVAERVLQSLFPNDDEKGHRVHRQHSQLSIAESLTEAIEDDSALSHSYPSDIVTPVASATTVPIDTHADIHIGSQTDGASVIEDSAPLDIGPQQEAEDSGDGGSHHRDMSSSGETTRSDQASLGNWMGTWWLKGKRNGRTPSSLHSEDSSGAVASDLSTSSQPDTDAVVELPATPQTVNKTGRRKVSRSVFGTLGFSILNPSAGAATSRKRRNVSVTDVGPVETPRPTQRSQTAESAASSPVRDTVLRAESPQLSVYLSPSKPPSVVSSAKPVGDEKPPQGASLRAIIQATRVMTSDPASILDDQGRDTSDFIAQRAMVLVRNAREAGLDFRKERKPDKPDGQHQQGHPVSLSSTNDHKPALGQVIIQDETRKLHTRRKPSVNLSSFASPLFGSFMAQQEKTISTVVGAVSRGYASNASSSHAQVNGPTSPTVPVRKPGSVPLESIIPTNAKPPTQFLSRTYTPLTSRDFHFSIPLPDVASALSVPLDEQSHEGMTDRYGFIYDVSRYDVLLLIRAKECSNTAPACLTGIKIADRREDNNWPEDEAVPDDAIEIVKEGCDLHNAGDSNETLSIRSSSTRRTVQSMPTAESIPHSSQASRGVSPSSSKGRKRTPAAVADPRSKTSILLVDSETPRHVCAHTIRNLMAQLVELHDERHAVQRKEWDAFLKRRSNSRKVVNSSGTRTAASAGAAALLGLGTADADEELDHSGGFVGFAQLGLPAYRDERKDFVRLVRGGIPLVYRSKAWLECSGGLEMREPGVFSDLLAQSDDENGAVREIEKDVGRTMPLNVFFGRTGAGVDKLRRVLIAYSRRNPTVGYCQGMNLVTSTLLLVFGDEEEAFWVLAAMIERILPPDFFSPSLLSSRACPLVLLDYVQEHMPKLYNHLTQLDVDLPAICFSWFLSLFTDCLPVETLFRVWDIFLVDGLDVLFRIAFGILRMSEQELLHCNSIPAVYVALESLPNRMWEIERLLQHETELRSTMLHADLVKRRDTHIASLKECMA